MTERRKSRFAAEMAITVVCTCSAGRFVAARSYGGASAGEVLPRL